MLLAGLFVLNVPMIAVFSGGFGNGLVSLGFLGAFACCGSEGRRRGWLAAALPLLRRRGPLHGVDPAPLDP